MGCFLVCRFSGMAALPFLDELDWSTVDAILITHFHLDHAASLTYVMEKVRLPILIRGTGQGKPRVWVRTSLGLWERKGREGKGRGAGAARVQRGRS